MKKNVKLAAIMLSLVVLLCACGKAKETSSKTDGAQTDNSSYSDDTSSDLSSNTYFDEFEDVSSGDDFLDIDFDSTESSGTSSYDETESSEESDDEEDNALYATTTSKYEILTNNEPPKKLTNKEMLEKCISEGLSVTETVIEIGLRKPVTIARITDSHLAYVNGADNAIAREQAAKRYKYFTNNDKKLQRCVNYANALGVDLVAFTGDIWDFFSVGNLEKFKSATSVLDDFLFAIGNHEDADVVGGNLPTGEKWTNIRKHISSYVKNDLTFATRYIGELTVVSMDNSRYTFTDEQVQKMKTEIAKGRPMLLMMHTPLYTEELYKKASENNEAGSIMPSVDKATGSTKEMLELINSNANLIKGVFTGHMHYDHISDLSSGIRQYMLRVSYSENGAVEIIKVK